LIDIDTPQMMESPILTLGNETNIKKYPKKDYIPKEDFEEEEEEDSPMIFDEAENSPMMSN